MLEAQEDLVAMVGADEDVRREAYRALEDVVSRIQETSTPSEKAH